MNVWLQPAERLIIKRKVTKCNKKATKQNGIPTRITILNIGKKQLILCTSKVVLLREKCAHDP